MLAVIAELNEQMLAFAPQHIRPPQKAMFRIYRDTRFSANKLPYKTHAGAWWTRQGLEKTSGAGYYFHVAADELVIAAGAYMPEREQLLAIRRHIEAHHKEFRKLLANRTLRKLLDEWEGAPLTRVPRASAPSTRLRICLSSASGDSPPRCPSRRRCSRSSSPKSQKDSVPPPPSWTSSTLRSSPPPVRVRSSACRDSLLRHAPARRARPMHSPCASRALAVQYPYLHRAFPRFFHARHAQFFLKNRHQTRRNRQKIGTIPEIHHKTRKKPVETAVLPLTNTLKRRIVDNGTVPRTRMNIGDSHRPATEATA
jgi:hypothetical protein